VNLNINYFLDKNNLDKIKHIPTVIVQGRYDLVCPFTTAWSLHKALPNAEFYPTIAGHSAFDDENIKYFDIKTLKEMVFLIELFTFLFVF
jgi:pimeloyl-ACP methyl ester carboxylesterase